MGDHHNLTHKRGLQPIWMLCLLVIAGSGPLPLWLHDCVCHRQAPHAGCGAAVGLAAPQNLGCCHSHGANPSDAGLDSGSEELASAESCTTASFATAACTKPQHSKQTRQWQAGAHSHDDCAACYTLSQVTTTQFITSELVTLLVLQYVTPVSDSRASQQTWSAYSSRGPPVI